MSDPTGEFFDQLGRRGHERLLAQVSGVMRFDLDHEGRTDHWILAITKGDVSVSREERHADCVVRADRVLFDRITSGEVNALAAWLRNQLTCDGDLLLLRFLTKVFPGPPDAHDPRPAARFPRGRR
ncbi:SCP2 sterol-binding domain-containing protein [Micromonospora sp. 15K316]|uniref:SCP2 sterol-binding domain-containing protein n=1 Tax=Micromonospora sp. 15K316 TaxID=2530376 RepID=UPI001404FAED|nr:SCP2 sterol-binding domain-containing protein [Micromonospora sp. 15K316]